MNSHIYDTCHANIPVIDNLHRDDIDDVNSVYDPIPLGNMGAIYIHQRYGDEFLKLQALHPYHIFKRFICRVGSCRFT